MVAVFGNALLATSKILSGIFGNSLAVLGDGMDSSGDVLISIMTVIAARIALQPPDTDHPYGHARADTVGSKVLAFVVFFLGAQLSLTAVQNFVSGNLPALPAVWTLGVVGFSILGKILLSLYLGFVSKKTGSFMLEANARNMASDVVISGVVLTGTALAVFTGWSWLDPLTAFLVGFWVMRTGWGIFKETSLEVMDGLEDTHLYKEVFECAEKSPGIFNPHKTRIRKFGPHYLIDMDVEVDPTLTVAQAHDLATNLEKALKTAIPEVMDVMIHVEPKGRGEHGESFGLKTSSIT
ncbi:MAG: hypothetical protein A2Z96_02545 [Spirochaetes bacterium GWB1_48_6]|nr:MAG: hypothetical protein A2Z96_02545 [Spirochaetes bacterium GWB1_48_6]